MDSTVGKAFIITLLLLVICATQTMRKTEAIQANPYSTHVLRDGVFRKEDALKVPIG